MLWLLLLLIFYPFFSGSFFHEPIYLKFIEILIIKNTKLAFFQNICLIVLTFHIISMIKGRRNFMLFQDHFCWVQLLDVPLR